MKAAVIAIVCMGSVASAEELPRMALSGPFASRRAACEAALSDRGDCASYRVRARASVRGAWSSFEIGSVADRASRLTHTKHFAVVAAVGKAWFATYVGTDGPVDVELFPPCKPGGGIGSCAPRHADMPSLYPVPRLAAIALDGGGQAIALSSPTTDPGEVVVQICGLDATRVPSCTDRFVALVSHGRAVTSAGELDLIGDDGKPPERVRVRF